MNIDVIGITGSKEHGKDTFAKVMQKYNPNYTIVYFASALKSMVSKIFDIPLEVLYDSKGKERLFETLIYVDDYVDQLRKETGLDIKPHGLVAESARKLLQYVGTDYVRSESPNYWVKKTEQDFPKKEALNPDMRFKNELDVIRRKHGYTVRVLRLDVPQSEDDHISENSIDDADIDLVLGTMTGDFSIMERVANLLLTGADTYLRLYDYRNIEPVLKAYSEGVRKTECLSMLKNIGTGEAIFDYLLKYYKIPLQKRR